MHQTVRVEGLEIAFQDVGSGAPAVILVHGAFADRTMFAPQIEHLAARHRVLAIDLRGHGDSDIPNSSVTFADFTADVLGVCAGAGIDRAIVGGHSVLGGGVAVALAAVRPDLVAGVALLDASIPYPEPMRTAQLEGLVPRLEGDDRPAALREFLGRLFDPLDPPELRAKVAAEFERAPAELVAPLMRAVFTEDFRSRLADGRYPLLHVHARAPVDSAGLRELRPDALFGSVIGSGHYLTLSATDQLNAQLDRFLEIAASHS